LDFENFQLAGFYAAVTYVQFEIQFCF